MGFRSFSKAALCLLLLTYVLPFVVGHGRLINPPSRASMWRLGFPSKQPDYNDNEGFCGGRHALHDRFEGNCGVCGDPWLPVPRQHERGGRHYTGEVTAYYEAGSVINAEVQVTANHKGFFEFRICPYDKPEIDDLELHVDGTVIEVTQSCLDKHVLPLANGKGTEYHITDKIGFFKVPLKLPEDLHCNKCLFQWRYKTGNSWGKDSNGKACIGCGDQEEFKACADVVIKPNGHGNIPTVRPTKHITDFDKAFKNDGWNHPPKPTAKPGIFPRFHTTETPKTNSTQEGEFNATKTSKPAVSPKIYNPEVATQSYKVGTCSPVPPYTQVPGMNKWCNINCSRGYCPASHCRCKSS